MSIENPTLKIRLVVPDNVLGKDCVDAARELTHADYAVLDAKWGRTPSDWRKTRGWGRTRLSEHQRGYVNAIDATAELGSVERALVEIIKGMTK